MTGPTSTCFPEGLTGDYRTAAVAEPFSDVVLEVFEDAGRLDVFVTDPDLVVPATVDCRGWFLRSARGRQQLAWVQAPRGIERGFDERHQLQLDGALLAGEFRSMELADAVFGADASPPPRLQTTSFTTLVLVSPASAKTDPS